NAAAACSRTSALLSLRRGCFGGWPTSGILPLMFSTPCRRIRGIGRGVGRVGEEPRTTSPTNEAYPLLGPSTLSYPTLAAHQRFHNQPSAIRINAVASMPAKTAPIIGQTAINFARCERGPRSTHAARRHGSKYFSQSHAAAHPPINERMNNKVVMLLL